MMGRLGDCYRAYVISRRSAQAADLLWRYYGLRITDEMRYRLMCLSAGAGGKLAPQALAMLYLTDMLDEYDGDPHAPIIHASVDFLLRRATAANTRNLLRDSIRFQRLREIAMRKYGWEP
ncbi:hypothetical protein CupriaWKF_30055 [Cupriavidus sp. WKF15]|uniref:hypothetical protein n=1 Tax=Cupriavidus sp. WKF15 TaxID=3032282 RepID=UPI0023E319A4|nr:hypothetical protein [Cupriavidus sp. WKF15]WER50622.1 hypothetical protein CupriaWKF_30055 [Cupriavidus sp. WKF15]